MLSESSCEHLIKNGCSKLSFDKKILDFLEGSLLDDITEALSKVVKKRKSFEIVRELIPYFNVTQQTVDKISKIYADSPYRSAKTTQDKKLLDKIVKEQDVNEVMDEANRYFNCTGASAVKVLYDPFKETLKLKPVASDRFIVYSYDQSEAKEPDVFIEIISMENISYEGIDIGNLLADSINAEVAVWTDHTMELYTIQNGKAYRNTSAMLQRGMFFRDKDGTPYLDSNGQPIIDISNPYKIIPFVYMNKSNKYLVPLNNEGMYKTTTNLPKIVALLNYCAQYKMSNLVYLKNAILKKGSSVAPDTVMQVEGAGPGAPEPDIGTIDNKVNVTEILKLVRFQLEAYLTSLGLRVAATESTGFQSISNIEGSISALFDLSDAVALHKKQARRFARYEKHLWTIIDKILIAENKNSFGPGFIENFNIAFEESKPVKSDSQTLDEVTTRQESGLITRRDALRKVYKDISDDDLEKKIVELDKEREEKLRVDSIVAGRGAPEDPNNKDKSFDPNGKQRSNVIDNNQKNVVNE